MSSFRTPILFLIFNRPDTTEIVFNVIRKQKPKYLFVAADGSRVDKEGEKEKCELARKIVLDNIDWDCELKTLVRDQNLGCGKAVSGAITWFFENVENGIIIEDDCLPNPTFFQYCEELLIRYKDDTRIMHISGTNPLKEWKINTQSYFFGQVDIWGWATWRRAWRKYDYQINDWQNANVKDKIKKGLKTKKWYVFFSEMLDTVYRKELDTWDVQWVYSVLINDGLSVNPSVNLVKNIGFNENGTHTHDSNHFIAKLENYEIKFPLKHPNNFKIDVQQLKLMEKVIFGDSTSFLKKISNFLFTKLKRNHFVIKIFNKVMSRKK